jgi:hypothetical protein
MDVPAAAEPMTRLGPDRPCLRGALGTGAAIFFYLTGSVLDEKV